MKIEIFTRSMNYQLYDAAMQTVGSLPYARHRLRAQTADGYLLAMLHSGADWAINIDEDAFVTDIEALKNLLQYCIDNDIVNCGMPDGGTSPIRKHNPLVTNPFFNIINLAALRKEYNKDVVAGYGTHKKEYEKMAPPLSGEYQYDYFESYCTFFVWISQNFKTLYLDATPHGDTVSTVLKNHDNQPFVTHTWYSRFYGIDPFHTQRINNIIDKYSTRTKENLCRAWSDRFYNEIIYLLRKKLNHS